MLTLSMVVVWESREQPAAALNHRCTEHWALRTTCSAVRTLSAIIAALNAMHWVVRRGESWGNPKMSLVLCQLVCNPSHRQEGGSPTFDQKKLYPKNYRLEYLLTDIITRTFAQQGQNGVFCHKSHLVLAKNSQICWVYFLRTKCSAKRDSPLHHINFCNNDLNIETTFTY